MITPSLDSMQPDPAALPASGDCYKLPVHYMGHTPQYWGDMAINWMPFALLLIFLYVLVASGRRRQKDYMKRYDQSVETQQKAYQELQSMNNLLAQIAEKMDKKAL